MYIPFLCCVNANFLYSFSTYSPAFSLSLSPLPLNFSSPIALSDPEDDFLSGEYEGVLGKELRG